MSIVISHNWGFFSCCSVKLHHIIEYVNKTKKLPDNVDCSQQFSRFYKPNPNIDITYDFFKYPICCDYIYGDHIDYHHEHQFKKYSTLDFKNIVPIFNIYFQPSKQIESQRDNFISKYNICYNNCIAVYYRGTDKRQETNIDSFESFHNKLTEMLHSIHNDNIQILLQSDSLQFLDYMKEKNSDKNLIIIQEVSASYTYTGCHNERTKAQNYDDMKNFLPIVLIMSKCKYVICTSGSVSVWILLYRGNSNNVEQNLSCKWI
jgi:hypothetical protein